MIATKTRIIANLSIGDMPTINEVLSILVKDLFLGIQETWGDEIYDNEPAAIKVLVNPYVGTVPYEIIERIKAAGVRVWYEFKLKEEIVIEESFKEYKILNYIVGVNRHKCGTIHNRSKGIVKRSQVQVGDRANVVYNRIPKVGEIKARS